MELYLSDPDGLGIIGGGTNGQLSLSGLVTAHKSDNDKNANFKRVHKSEGSQVRRVRVSIV